MATKEDLKEELETEAALEALKAEIEASKAEDEAAVRVESVELAYWTDGNRIRPAVVVSPNDDGSYNLMVFFDPKEDYDEVYRKGRTCFPVTGAKLRSDGLFV